MIYGGIYASALHQENRARWGSKYSQKFRDLVEKLEAYQETIRKFRDKSKEISLFITKRFKSHISRKQEIYWPVLIAITLLLFVFASRIAFAETGGVPNNLPIESDSKLNIIGFKVNPDPVETALAAASAPQNSPDSQNENDPAKEDLRNDVKKIVKNTPMAAMVDPISEKDRTVAAFIVGIAMKESKFGVYSPKMGGRDCYNYWGFKGGGKTVSGGYSCFASPEDAVSAVGKRIDKLVKQGVKTPSQMVVWKCGSNCRADGNAGKWISDVALNFNKINS